jgi:RHS repeat-associated protein
MLTGTTFTWLHDDHIGTPQVATNASQAVVWKASYLPFGETIATSGTVTVNLRFPGQYYDAETGFNHNGFRDYVPVLGRYLETDPLGIVSTAGLYSDLNPYVYAGGTPMSLTDPLGLLSKNMCFDKDQNKFSCPGNGTDKVDQDSAGRQMTSSSAPCTARGQAELNNPTQGPFITTHLADATTVANDLNVPLANILGLSALESGWGAGPFVVNGGNNFFSQHMNSASQILPFSTGEIPGHAVMMGQYNNYLDSANSFAASRGGQIVQGIADPADFATTLQNAGLYGINPDGSKDPDFVPSTASTIRGVARAISCIQ